MATLVLAAEHSPRKTCFHLSEDVENLIHSMQQSIARRAYELFEERQSLPGDDLRDWLKAELDLTFPVVPVVTEFDDRVDVQLDLDVFGDDLEIGIEPLAVVFGTSRRTFHCGEGVESMCEMRTQPLFRTVPLPVAVQPAATVTMIGNRLLRIALPKPAARNS